MTSPGSSKVSAYQVFSAVTKVTPDSSIRQDRRDFKQKRKSSQKNDEIPQRESSVPKSLLDMANEMHLQKNESLIDGKRNSVTPSRHGKKRQSKLNDGSVKSLLDISFDGPSPCHEGVLFHSQDRRRKDPNQALGESTIEDKHPYSEPRGAGREQLIIKSGTPTSNMRPMVVDMKTQPSPKPLLDFSSLSSLQSRPMNLQRVNHTKTNRRESLRLKGESTKKEIDSEVIDSTRNDNVILSSTDYNGSSPRKKVKSEIQTFSKIQICQGKRCLYLIIPASFSWLHLKGKAKLSVELGIVSIMAYTLQANVSYDVYSPTAGCLLALHVEAKIKFPAHDVKAHMSNLCDQRAVNSLTSLADDTIAVIRVKDLDSTMCDYLTSFIPFTQLFKIALPKQLNNSDQVGINLDLGLKVAPQSEMTETCMNWSPEYNDVLEKWSMKVSSNSADGQGPILVTCGGKNSGKSTLNRCAINVTLQSIQEVAFLDCDIGQTEFSPPATLSLHIIKRPIFEPPFCHQRPAEKMVFYGDVTPSQDPSLYVRCLHYIFEAYTAIAAKSYLPLIVNTMGFLEGVGLMLFIDTMNIVKPDMVVQIESTLQYSNLPAVTRDMVALDEGWTFNKLPSESRGERVKEIKAHELVLLPSLANPKRDFSLKLQPLDLRNLALLSSLSAGLEKDTTLTSRTPYAVPFKNLAVHICHHNLSSAESLIALDASVVALCEADLSQTTRESDDLPLKFQEVPVCHCVGIGFIRAVDKAKGTLLIVTTVPWVTLRKVNAILKGSPSLPDHFFLNQKGTGTKTLAYVDALAPSMAVAAVRPRSRMPRVSLGKD